MPLQSESAGSEKVSAVRNFRIKRVKDWINNKVEMDRDKGGRKNGGKTGA